MIEARREIDGVPTFSRTAGTGPNLLLLHGIGVSSRYWIPALRALAQRGFRAHAVDLPGFGRSGTPAWPLTVTRLSAHVSRWAEAALSDRFDLVGQSFGCEFAVLGALALPERVGRVVLAAPNGLPERRSVTAQLLWAAADAPREPLSLYRAIVPDYLRSGPARILRMLIQQRDDRTEALLPDLRQPVLLLRGARDPVVSPSRLERIGALLPHSRTREIPGAHGAHFTHPEAFADAVAAFLAER